MNVIKCEVCGSTLNAEQAAKYEKQRDAEKKALIKQAEIDARAKIEAAFERKLKAEREEWEKEGGEIDAKHEREVQRLQRERDEARRARDEKYRRNELAEQRRIEQGVETAMAEERKRLAAVKREAKIKEEQMESQLAKVSQELAAAQRKLEQPVAQVTGEAGERELYDVLRDAFPGDRCVRVNKRGHQSDIVLHVQFNTQQCGTILIERKNVNGPFATEWIRTLRSDVRDMKADCGIIVPNHLPKEFAADACCTIEEFLVTKMEAVRTLVAVVRERMVSLHRLGAAQADKVNAMARVFAMLTRGDAQEILRKVTMALAQKQKDRTDIQRKLGTYFERDATGDTHIQHAVVSLNALINEAIEGTAPKLLPGNGSDSNTLTL